MLLVARDRVTGALCTFGGVIFAFIRSLVVFFWFSALLGDVTNFREDLLALRGGNWGPGRGDRFVSWESSGFRRLFRVFGS